MTPPNPQSASLNDHQKKVLDTLRSMGAVTEEKARSAEEIMKLTKQPKGRVLAIIQELEKMKIVERAHSSKTHKYFAKA